VYYILYSTMHAIVSTRIFLNKLKLTYGMNDFVSIPISGFCSALPCPERFWGTSSLISNEYSSCFPAWTWSWQTTSV